MIHSYRQTLTTLVQVDNNTLIQVDNDTLIQADTDNTRTGRQ